ncbi:MAG: zf-HC2 domain-containing protein [Bryobacteraceae bacterium]
MTCLEVEPLLGASLDDELDPRAALAIEQHLSSCDSCSKQYKNLEWLREEIGAAGLDFGTQADLKSLRASILRRNRKSWWDTAWKNPAVFAAAAAGLIIALMVPGIFPSRNSGVERQLVDNHVRSLMADHLVDVPSSDRHTVKPWFQGKLGFSPAVPDLGADGFVLTGGRLDVVASRPAAAIIYKRNSHVINLSISEASAAAHRPELTVLDGYNVLRWQSGGMAYWAVSDLNATELREFARLFQSRAQPPPGS